MSSTPSKTTSTNFTTKGKNTKKATSYHRRVSTDSRAGPWELAIELQVGQSRSPGRVESRSERLTIYKATI